MTVPTFRSLDQLTGDLADRPSAFFAALAEPPPVSRAEYDAVISDLADARGELDNTMQSVRDLGAMVRDLTSQNAMWHAERDEQRERGDEWRDKAEDYLATIDELQGELRAQQDATRGLQNALAAAESARDTYRAMADL